MNGELFSYIPLRLDELLGDLESGKLGLPDLQRPYVWKDKKVRDLLDSMVRGFPIGFTMIWACPDHIAGAASSAVGTNEKRYPAPQELVIDGQQRLTGLLSALAGIEIVDSRYQKRKVGVAYNPLTNVFEAPNASREKSPEWIIGLDKVFRREKELSLIRMEYIEGVNRSRERQGQPGLSLEEAITVENNLNALDSLKSYSIPSLRLSEKADLDTVAVIFSRANSGGQKLSQNDFIETLLSVYSRTERTRIEEFCERCRAFPEDEAYNLVFQPDRSNIIRTAYAYGFNRAVLRYAIKLLSGEDLKTRTQSAESRDESHRRFGKALDDILDMRSWNDFLRTVMKTGVLNREMLTSNNALAFSYNLFLTGRNRFGMTAAELEEVIPRWIFMAMLTSLYSGSFETQVEYRLRHIRELKTKEEFAGYLNSVIESRLNDGFFEITLPAEMGKTQPGSPSWKMHLASKILAGKPVFFGTTPLSAYWAARKRGESRALDIHHIFPKDYLEKLGYEKSEINSNANKVYIERPENLRISNRPPEEYVREYREKRGEEAYRRLCQDHDLPEGFENMEYREFLAERARLMSRSVREAFKTLG